MEICVNTDMRRTKAGPEELFGANNKANELIPIMVMVPRGALDILSFRYYQLGIIENNKALVEAAVQELVQRQLSQEMAIWNMRTKGDAS